MGDKQEPIIKKLKSNDPYYQSSYWRKYRKSVMDDPNCKCRLCNKSRFSNKKNGIIKNKGFTLHHLHYYSLYNEDESSTVPLCYSCHRILHDVQHRAPELGSVLDRIQELLIKSLYTDLE